MKIISDLSVGVKLWAIPGLACVGLIFMVFISLREYHATLMEDRKNVTRNQVDTVIGVLEAYNREVQEGKIEKPEAQARAIELINKLRYDGDNYYWINDLQPRMIMHPIQPDLNGQDLSTVKDGNGLLLFLEFVDVVKRNGGGFVPYLRTLPDSGVTVPKLSYVKGFEAWGWVIGTGIHIDDVQAMFWGVARKLIGVLLATLVIVSMLAYVIAGNVTRPVKQLRNVIGRVAKDGDLRLRSNIQQADEVGLMASDFDSMLESLQQFVRSVEETSNELRGRSEQLLQSAKTTQHAMDQQQGEANQVASAMTEMSASAHEVSVNVASAVDAAQDADNQSSLAAEMFSSAIKSMQILARDVEDSALVIKRVREDGQSIRKVLDVIRAIAEQTNLLALNAAIEAARAGERGRGFAVVADEVRTLAHRTQESTQEIHSMIEALQLSTGQAVSAMEANHILAKRSDEEAERAKVSLVGITSAIERIRDMALQIGSSVEEQKRVAEDINRNMVNIATANSRTAEDAKNTANQAQRFFTLTQDLQSKTTRYQG